MASTSSDCASLCPVAQSSFACYYLAAAAAARHSGSTAITVAARRFLGHGCRRLDARSSPSVSSALAAPSASAVASFGPGFSSAGGGGAIASSCGASVAIIAIRIWGWLPAARFAACAALLGALALAA